jgi:hypothetical protein
MIDNCKTLAITGLASQYYTLFFIKKELLELLVQTIKIYQEHPSHFYTVEFSWSRLSMIWIRFPAMHLLEIVIGLSKNHINKLPLEKLNF